SHLHCDNHCCCLRMTAYIRERFLGNGKQHIFNMRWKWHRPFRDYQIGLNRSCLAQIVDKCVEHTDEAAFQYLHRRKGKDGIAYLRRAKRCKLLDSAQWTLHRGINRSLLHNPISLEANSEK